MKKTIHILTAIAAIAAFACHAVAGDPIGDNLFPPDLVMRAHEAIALTDEQRQWLQAEAEKSGTRFKELQEQLQKESGALATLIQAERVDPAAVLVQLDKLLEAEREMKRAQIGFLISIKNQLTPEQQKKLLTFRKEHGNDAGPNEELQKRLGAKLERVRTGVERWQAEGTDPSPIAAIMQEFEPLMKESKHKEAESVLDRALKELGEDGVKK